MAQAPEGVSSAYAVAYRGSIVGYVWGLDDYFISTQGKRRNVVSWKYGKSVNKGGGNDCVNRRDGVRKLVVESGIE
jgi:hypothetical protein